MAKKLKTITLNKGEWKGSMKNYEIVKKQILDRFGIDEETGEIVKR